MKIIWILLYNLIAYPLLFVAGIILSFFNVKLRKGILGRFNSLSVLSKYFHKNLSSSIYWFHAASLGEFYQVKPVIDGLKDVEPECKILLSFSSPSGFENAKCKSHDLKIYLPFDFPWTIVRALKIVRPKKLIFASYDIWPNLVWIANLMGIHTNIFAARIKDGSPKLLPGFFNFYQNVYRTFSTIYTVSEKDYSRMKILRGNVKNPLIRSLGNPRYDMVKQHADEFSKSHQLSILNRPNRIIIGSSHSSDDKLLMPVLIQLLKQYPDLQILHVPHEPSKSVIKLLQDLYSKAGYPPSIYKSKTQETLPTDRVVVVSIVGVLSTLYWQGRYSYIGGGFSTGIHNVMEPAIARLPVLFGPKYHHAHEAEELIEKGGGFCIKNEQEVYSILNELISDKQFFQKTIAAATDVIHDNLGSSTRIIRGIIRD